MTKTWRVAMVDHCRNRGRGGHGTHLALFGFADGVRGQFESRRGLYDGGETRMGITVVGSEATLAVRYDEKRALRLRRSRRPLEEGGPFEEVSTLPLADRRHPLGVS